MSKSSLRPGLRALLTAALLALASIIPFAIAGPTAARADDKALVEALAADAFAEKVAAIEALAKSGSPRATPVLQALTSGNLFKRKADGILVIAETGTSPLEITDAATGADLGVAAEADLDQITANNRIRRLIEDAMGALTLMSPDARTRIDAAEAILKSRNASSLPALEAAIAAEKDATVLSVMKQASAALVVADEGASTEKRLAAIEALRLRGGQDSLGLIETAASSKDAAVATKALRLLPPSKRALRSGATCKTSCMACHSAPYFCSRPSALPSPSASWVSSTWRTARW